ncbi:DMT family transporter [Paracoccus aminophilus]|uniref:DMT family transporter n=1 Tax=Paracoccus aminophilus TaxID=34003 RepID=UPI000400117B|nr:DMT family transporter [Paracoccus aminophilus]
MTNRDPRPADPVLTSPAPARAARAPRPLELTAALATGALLTVMLLSNSAMARATSPLFSSLTAHAVGTLTAVLALIALRLARPASTPQPGRRRAPLWAYLGGVSGAITVVLTSAAANSALALTGTLALGLVGQLVLALIFDATGMMGLARRRPSKNELVALALIVAGTLLIIFARG